MVKYPLISVTWVTLVAATIGGRASGQVVTKMPNKLGLNIESVNLGTEKPSAKILFLNTTSKPITAYVIRLAPSYSDGERLSGERFVDFFASQGLSRFIPSGAGTLPDGFDVIVPGAVRESTLIYDQPRTVGARLTSIIVEVTGVVFEDENTAGDSKQIDGMVRRRDEESSEVVRWCGDIEKFTAGPVPRQAVNDILAAHAPPPESAGRSLPGKASAENERIWLSRAFHQD